MGFCSLIEEAESDFIVVFDGEDCNLELEIGLETFSFEEVGLEVGLESRGLVVVCDLSCSSLFVSEALRDLLGAVGELAEDSRFLLGEAICCDNVEETGAEVLNSLCVTLVGEEGLIPLEDWESEVEDRVKKELYFKNYIE